MTFWLFHLYWDLFIFYNKYYKFHTHSNLKLLIVNRPHGKESTEVQITQKIENKEKTFTKKLRDLRRKGTHKHVVT